MTKDRFDVVVIGAGVVGAAIARELSRYRLRCAMVEAAADVGTGTSKANTAILHTGFDAKPGTLEARLLPRGYTLLRDYAAEAGIPVEPVGALLIAWNEGEVAALDEIETNARRNGYLRARRLSVGELYRREPNLGSGAAAAVEIPDEGIICPFTTPLAFATQAVVNDVELLLDQRVEAIRPDGGGGHELMCRGVQVRARYLVNAAGLFSDVIDRLLGHETFSIVPRRGELIVFDKLARALVSHILMPVPTPTTKGVLVAPTVFGNVLLGPTAEDVRDRTGMQSTKTGLERLREQGARLVPQLLSEEVTAVYVGLRAATEHGDYQIAAHLEQRYVCVGGIRSTGLSASMAIAEHVVQLLAEAGLELSPKPAFAPVRMPNIGEVFVRPYQDAEAIARDADYGRIVCHCERVTLGEIRDAARAAVPARSLDALARRTRATLGRCQGFYCGARVASLLGWEAAGR